jgi:hypothetical protein
LSLGQVRGQGQLLTLRQQLQTAWQPIAFTVCGVSLIWRGEPPDDVFRVAQTVRLGAQEL